MSDTGVTIFLAISILYGLICVILVCAFCYLALGRSRKSKRRVLPTVAVITGLAVTGLLAKLIVKDAYNLLPIAVITLMATLVLGTTLYYRSSRSLMQDDDFSIQSVVILWIAATGTAGLAWGFLALGGEFASKPGLEIPYPTLFAAASAIVAAFGIAFTFVMGSEQNNRNARQQLYQTLENQSILLFRFESDHEDHVLALWIEKKPPTDRITEFCVKQYICQILNLFEMAVRFQIQGVLPKDVFGSWVIWMWELCKQEPFHYFWLNEDELPFNYISELRGIITEGIKFAKDRNSAEKSEAVQRKAFFDVVARRLKSPEISSWFQDTDDLRLLEELKKKTAPPTTTR